MSADADSKNKLPEGDERGRLRRFLARNERKISFLAFVAGFIWDGLTLVYVNLFEAGIILGGYIFLIGVGILFFNRIRSKILPNVFLDKINNLVPYAIQFMFGTLFNAAFIFYGRSAELSSSWLFIVFLVLIILGNELFRKGYKRLLFQLLMFFIASFLYFVFIMPIVLGEMSDRIFLLGGGVSLLVLFLLMYFLSKLARARFLERHVLSVLIILFFYGIFNFLYFKNLIPPIPLALKDSSLYYNVYKSGDNYHALYEPAKNPIWSKESRDFNLSYGSPAFVFTSIFAPVVLSVPIYHEWNYYDESVKKWVLKSRVGFSISGGRDGGYRGYSIKENVTLGRWRVDITTGNGKKLGRLYFKAVSSDSLPILKSDVR